MSKISLKAIIKKNETGALILSLANGLKSESWIEDESGNLIFGNPGPDSKFSYPVTLQDQVIGFVKGDENASPIAGLLVHLAQKEAEKKKLGSEVLNLYLEINMIYNFSEKLAQTIDAPAICAITLNEARREIRSDNGVIILWDEKTRKLGVIDSSDDQFFNQETINRQADLLLKIIWGVQSEIISDPSFLKDAGIVMPEVNSLIYSALKVNHRVMGVIVLGSNEDILHTAADLKLLSAASVACLTAFCTDSSAVVAAATAVFIAATADSEPAGAFLLAVSTMLMNFFCVSAACSSNDLLSSALEPEVISYR